MTTKTEAQVISDVILSEEDGRYCRETRIIEAGTGGDTMAPGVILEPGSGTNKKRVVVAGNATEICLEAGVIAASSTASFLVLARGPAVVKKAGLDYNSLTEATVDAALLAKDIVVRTGPTY